MYRILLSTGSGTKNLFTPEITVKSWSFRVNAPGSCVFSIPTSSPKATDENLRHYNRVTLYRKPRNGSNTYVPEWYGYIDAVNQVGEDFEVLCTGALGIFRKRYTGTNEQFNGEGSVEAFGLLTDTNGLGDTGITTGTGNVETTRDLTLSDRDILSAWEEQARAHGAEFEVDAGARFNFVQALGTDRTLLKLLYRLDGRPGTNAAISLGEDGRPMANRIIGTSSASGGLTSTQNDTASQTKYGIILVERKTFNEANDQATLDSMTQAYLTQRANPVTDIVGEPSPAAKRFNPITGEREISGIQYGDVSIGDLITAEIVTPSRTITETKRIAELSVSVDENANERLSLTLSKAGVFITAAYLDASEIGELRRKVAQLEAIVS